MLLFLDHPFLFSLHRGLVDFTWGGRLVCMFLCVIGIALCAIPVGSLFDSFGTVIGLAEDEKGEEGHEVL